MAARINLDDHCYCSECGELFLWEETIRGENANYENVRMCYNCFEDAKYQRKVSEDKELSEVLKQK